MTIDRFISICFGSVLGFAVAFSIGLIILVITGVAFGGMSDNHYLLLYLLYPLCMLIGGIIGGFVKI